MSQTEFESRIWQKINSKTKPLGALGLLEKVAFQVASVQQSLVPELLNPHIVVFAGSHGIASEGVSAFPSEVTGQMVLNFLSGGAAINVFARQHDIELVIVDAGVDFMFEEHEKLINNKIDFGTKSFLTAQAMTADQCMRCLEKGAELVTSIHQKGSNVIGFGEMGIGNTSAAAVIMSKLLGISIKDCAGRGTGLNEEQLAQKIAVLTEAIDFHKDINHDPIQVLQTFAGFEMTMMCGAMLEAYRKNMILLVDGFIASVVFLCAFQLENGIRSNAIFCHQSEEKGHRILLDHLNAEPLLQLSMRLGEGTGCAVAYPVLKSGVAFLNEMASFDSAKVSERSL